MDLDELNATIARLTTRGALTNGLLVNDTPDRGDHVVAGLVVDLAAAVDAARSEHAGSLTVYCDSLRVDGIVNIDTAPGRVSVIARQIFAGSDSVIRLAHFDPDDQTRLRLACRTIEGDLRIVSARKKDVREKDVREDYPLDALRAPHAVPHFTNFVAIDGTPTIATTRVPVGLLADGEPLHRTLAESFALAAGLLSENDNNPILANLAHEILSWLSDWSGLQDDIADIARLSERLRKLIPLEVDGRRTYPIPDLTTDDCIELIAARTQFAQALELDEKFLDQQRTIEEIAADFAKATAERDAFDVERTRKEIQTLQAREPTLLKARDIAANAIIDHQFEQKIARIELDLAIEHDKIDKIEKASFDIAIGLVTLGTSIAAICIGVPTDPSAAAKKDIEGVEGLIDTFRSNWESKQAGNPFTFFRHIDNLLFLYKVPFTFVWKNKGTMKDSFEALAKSGLAIKTAAGSINGAGDLKGKLNEIVTTLDEALRNLAEKPGVIEARAAWDAIELEAVNQLDRVINDGETVANIKERATVYKTTLQKMAVYGRAMAEHQAAIDANQREIAARLLQRCSQIRQQDVSRNLATEFKDRAALDAHIGDDLRARLKMAARSHFVACYGYRRAQFYETLTHPVPVALGQTVTDMVEALSVLKTAQSYAATTARRRSVTFCETLSFTDDDALLSLLAGKPITWTIPSDSVSREVFDRLRMTHVEMRLETDEEGPGEISFDLVSASSFGDRAQGEPLHFAGPLVSIPFDYDGSGVTTQRTFSGVLPTPFSEWMVSLREGRSTAGVRGLTLRIEGSAFQ